MECLKFTISKGIGIAIVAGSSILKLPQIIKIVSGKSVEGLSSISYYIEVCLLSIFYLILFSFRQQSSCKQQRLPYHKESLFQFMENPL
jgi:mannose-P-dolichol utilization defect protein 1